MKRTVVAAIVAAGAVAALVLAFPLQAGPPPQSVNVTNDASSPVPVSVGGPVTVGGTVTVAGSVGVTGTAATRAADNPAYQAVSRFTILSVPAGSREDRVTLYTVPAGKRLIVQSETASTIANGVRASITISTQNNGGGGIFYDIVPQVSRGFYDGQGEIWEGSHEVAQFGDPGTIVEARAWASATVPPGGGVRTEVGFSGYLVDLP